MNYEIKFSKRKSISISVKGDKIIVKAPFGTPSAIIDKMLHKHRLWIAKRIAAEEKRLEVDSKLTPSVVRELKKDAKIYFKEKIEQYSSVMGVSYRGIKITSAERRFGSCSSKGNICFSYRLMLYPAAAREYVVVHELAHLREMNHSKRFYAIVEGVMPDWRARRKLLSDLNCE